MATLILHKFIINASWCEYFADLHVIAATEAEALAKWEAAFTPTQKAGLSVRITNCTEKPFMLEYWKQNEDCSDYSIYSGGYRYSDF